jgi:hypothetical protein
MPEVQQDVTSLMTFPKSSRNLIFVFWAGIHSVQLMPSQQEGIEFAVALTAYDSLRVILQHGVGECFWMWLPGIGYFQNAVAHITVLMPAFVPFSHKHSERQHVFTEALLLALWYGQILKKIADKRGEKFYFQCNRVIDKWPVSVIKFGPVLNSLSTTP